MVSLTTARQIKFLCWIFPQRWKKLTTPIFTRDEGQNAESQEMEKVQGSQL